MTNRSFLKKSFTVLLLVAFSSTSAIPADTTTDNSLLTDATTRPAAKLHAFTARYEIFSGDRKMGESIVHLSPADGHWRLKNTVHGTHGLASLLGFKRQEETVFNWRSTPERQDWLPLSYRFSQKVAFKKKTRSFRYDPVSHQATGKSGGKQWTLDIHPPFISPNLVVLALARDLCDGQKDLHYQVLEKGTLKDYYFEVNGVEDGLIKVSKKHGHPDRITESWHDPQQQCLNVRSRHKEPGDDWVETRLVSTSSQPQKSNSADVAFSE